MLDAEQRRYLCYLVHLERMRLLPVDELGAAYQTFAATGKNPLPHRLNELGFNNLQQYHLNQLIDQTWLAIAESPQLISDFFLRETGEQAFLCSIDDPPVRAWCAELFSLKKTAFDQRNGEAPTLANGEPPHSSQHSNGHTNAVHSADAIPPAKIKTRFELVEPPLAGGGQGAIYRAYDNYLSRYVAVKKLKEQSSAGAPGQPSEASKRLVAEARITARLQHPNIIQIYDLSEQDTGPSFAMQLLQDTEGNKTETYQDLIKKHHALNAAGQAGLRNASLRRLLEQLVVVCRSIHYAHTQGVFHRDLKPLNILCGQHGDIQVIDWGLAKLTHERVWSSLYETERMSPESMGLPQTKLGQLSGSPVYMSPEQYEGNSNVLTKSTDIYSLGVILYYILAERIPFEGENPEIIGRKVKNADFSRPTEIQPEIPPGLEAICLRAMQKKPEQRYPTAGVLADDLQRWLDGERPLAFEENRWQTLKRWFVKRPEYQVLLATMAYVNPALFVMMFIMMPALWYHMRSGSIEKMVLYRDLGVVSTGIIAFGMMAVWFAQFCGLLGFISAGIRYLYQAVRSTTTLDMEPPKFEPRGWIKNGFLLGFICFPFAFFGMLLCAHTPGGAIGFRAAGGTPRSLLMLEACSVIYILGWITAIVWVYRRVRAAPPVERPQIQRKVYNTAWLSLMITSPISVIVALLIFFLYTPDIKDYFPPNYNLWGQQVSEYSDSDKKNPKADPNKEGSKKDGSGDGDSDKSSKRSQAR